MSDLPSISITRIARAEDETLVTLSVTIEADGRKDKRWFLVPEKFFFEERLKKGEITPEIFERIERESKKCRAYLRGANILGYGANSEKKLTEKLQKRGFDRETATSAAKKLKNDGFIDEEKDATACANACVRKLWGKRRIAAKLYEKGFEEEAIKSALDSLETVDFTENCKKLIAKKAPPPRSARTSTDAPDRPDEISSSRASAGGFASPRTPTDRKELEKLTAFLLRYGYSLSEIKETYRQTNN